MRLVHMGKSKIVIGLSSPIQVVQLKQFGCGLKVFILLMMITETEIVGKYLERELVAEPSALLFSRRFTKI